MENSIEIAEAKEIAKLKYLGHQQFLEVQIRQNQIRKRFSTRFEKEFEKRIGLENQLKNLEVDYNLQFLGNMIDHYLELVQILINQ